MLVCSHRHLHLDYLALVALECDMLAPEHCPRFCFPAVVGSLSQINPQLFTDGTVSYANTCNK